VVFHEKEVSALIKNRIKQQASSARLDQAALLADLAARQLRFLRQRKVDIKSLYS